MIRPVALAALIVILISPARLYPQETTARPRLVVWVVPAGQALDGEIARLVSMAIAIELDRLGPRPTAGTGTPDLETAARLARSRGADGFILARVRDGGDRIEIELVSEHASVRVTGVLDLDLGARVEAAVRELLAMDPPPAAGAPVVEAAPAAATATPATPALAKPGTPVPGGVSTPPVVRRWGVQAGFGGFLTVGTAAHLLPVAGAALLRFRVVPPVAGDHLSLGIRLSTIAGRAHGELVAGPLLLLPVGVEAALEMGGSSPVSASLAALGGVAALLVAPGGIRTFAKAVPWLGGAVGFAARLTPRLRLCAETAFLVVIEEYAPLLGLVPAVSLHLSL